MSNIYDFTIGPSGAQPTPPATLLADLIASVTAVVPGITFILPASLIEDVSSTEVGALVMCDTAAVETINSISPSTANPFMLSQLGQVYLGPGSAPAVPTNTSVYVVFYAEDASSNPLPGYVIPVGFTVSDGTYQYIIQNGGVTTSSGYSSPIFCQATIPGTWAVPTNSVSQIVTSVPGTITLTCTNPTPGTSGGPAETQAQYRARVVQAGQAISTGTPQQLKTLLGQVPGVQQRLISVVQAENGNWEIIVGGGDPYEVANAICDSGINIQGVTGSTLAITAVTQAVSAQITTDINHGYSAGQQATATGIVGMTNLNGILFTVETIIDEKNFTINVNTTGFPAYVSGGVLSPNLRNVTVSIYDYPDQYAITFVNPPQQTVTIAVTWNTTGPNFVSQSAIKQLAGPVIAAYINSIPVGQPINALELDDAFIEAVASVLPESQISVLTYAVSINGVSTPPQSGTKLYQGDPESFFEATFAGITFVQG
jgi:hypothetical protein